MAAVLGQAIAIFRRAMAADFHWTTAQISVGPMAMLVALAMASPGALAIGLASGTEFDAIGYLTARYFGARSYGRIYGLFYLLYLVGSALSMCATARCTTRPARMCHPSTRPVESWWSAHSCT